MTARQRRAIDNRIPGYGSAEVEALTPDGWHLGGGYYVDFYDDKSKDVQIKLGHGSLTHVYVDNRGLAKGTFTCGQWSASFDADGFHDLAFPRPKEGALTNNELELNGKSILTMAEGTNYLIDLSQKHAYLYGRTLYISGPGAPIVEDPHRDFQRFAPALVHRVGPITHAFRPVPRTLQTGAPEVWQLMEQ